jgi:hypothetical protein
MQKYQPAFEQFRDRLPSLSYCGFLSEEQYQTQIEQLAQDFVNSLTEEEFYDKHLIPNSPGMSYLKSSVT